MNSFGIENIDSFVELLGYGSLHNAARKAFREYVIPYALESISPCHDANNFDQSEFSEGVENVTRCVANAFEQELFAAIVQRHEEDKKSYAF